MRRFVFAAFALTVLAACQPATTELTDEQEAEIAAEVNAIRADFWDAWKVNDGGGMSYYNNSPNLAFGVEGQLVHGWDTYNDAVEASTWTTQEIAINDSKTIVLAPNVVYVMDQGTYIESFESGETGPETAFAYTAIWLRQDGEWKVHFGHVSFPTPETP